MADPRFRKLYFPDFIKTPQLSIMPDYGVLKFLYCYENLNNRVKFNSIYGAQNEAVVEVDGQIR